jgi:hypothetical protein
MTTWIDVVQPKNGSDNQSGSSKRIDTESRCPVKSHDIKLTANWSRPHVFLKKMIEDDCHHISAFHQHLWRQLHVVSRLESIVIEPLQIHPGVDPNYSENS